MEGKVSEDTKKKIFQLISTPGIEIEEIAKIVNLDYDIVMDMLANEYLRTNFNYGRRLCCRF